jgi:hypothetical protein
LNRVRLVEQRLKVAVLRLQAFCAKQGIPVIEAQAHERKHALAQPYLPSNPMFCGLFLVIKSNAPAPIWQVKRNGEGRITEISHRKNWPYVRHFFFHLIHREWGHVTIRMCSYPPFGAQVILNGHEWVERHARRRRVAAVKDGNCFIDGSDFAAISRLATKLNGVETIARLRHLCERSGSTRPAWALRSPPTTASAAALTISIPCSNWN